MSHRLSAYRTALKLRQLQIGTQLSNVTLTEVQNNLRECERLVGADPTSKISADQITTLLLQLYSGKDGQLQK